MEVSKIKSYCKINLSLKVIEKLNNGYHNIASLITFCDLHDLISLTKNNKSKDKITFSGRSELKTLTNIDRDINLVNSYLSKKSYSLLYINELMIKLLPKDAEHKPLFDLYAKFIFDANKEEKMDYLLRNFELDLLDMLGYGINFHFDISNEEEIQKDKNYIFIAESGFMMSKNKKDFSGEDIINIRERNFINIPTKTLKQLTQATIMFCLEGKDLNSRQIFRRIEK